MQQKYDNKLQMNWLMKIGEKKKPIELQASLQVRQKGKTWKVSPQVGQTQRKRKKEEEKRKKKKQSSPPWSCRCRPGNARQAFQHSALPVIFLLNIFVKNL